ncbi:MAG: S8 family peptidase, partial [Anaerovoracaceae bacterium]
KYMELNKVHKSYQGSGVKIGIIDTGVSKEQKTEVSINLLDDVQEYDNNGHGSYVYELIKETAPKAKVFSIKVMDKDEKINAALILKALKEAERLKLDIVNLSIGTHKENDLIAKQLEHMTKKGTIVLSSAGDYGENTMLFPANQLGIISVGALSANGMKWDDNNAEDEIDTFFPGDEISVKDYLNQNKEKHIEVSGSSYATAIGSGYVAILLESKGELSPFEVEKYLKKFKENEPLYSEVILKE